MSGGRNSLLFSFFFLQSARLAGELTSRVCDDDDHSSVSSEFSARWSFIQNDGKAAVFSLRGENTRNRKTSCTSRCFSKLRENLNSTRGLVYINSSILHTFLSSISHLITFRVAHTIIAIVARVIRQANRARVNKQTLLIDLARSISLAVFPDNRRASHCSRGLHGRQTRAEKIEKER